MKKIKLTPIILATANLVVCLCLLIFMTPNSVPLFTGIHNEYILFGSKWWMIIGIVLPIIFMVLSLTLKNKSLKLIFIELIIFMIYENMLAFSLFCTEPNLALGQISKISLSISIFLPLSLAVFIFGSIIKNVGYKNKMGITSKNITTTEFIWKQSHYSASFHFRLAGLILFFVSIAFIFINYPLIELGIFAIGIIAPRIIVEVQAKQMTNKYFDMKKKQEHIQNKKN